MPLAAIGRAVKPGIRGNHEIPGINKQARMTNVFDSHRGKSSPEGVEALKE
jgi:hypothetical protein